MTLFAFEALATDPRERLDKLVVARLERDGTIASRASVQRWIEEGRVLVDGAPLRASSAVRAGATVEVRPAPPPPSEAQPDASVVFEVVFEDAHLLVIDKPAGLVVHPARGHLDKTLVNGLLAREGFGAQLSDDASEDEDAIARLRPGIVHRLDKGTSGLMVVAKDEATREGLKALFAAHDIEREYVAIVAGRAESRTVATLHGRHPTDRIRFSSRVERGKRAITHVRVLERFLGATLVACTLETGRTHQIRVHLAEQLGTPVLADPLYGQAGPKRKKTPGAELVAELEGELGRQALHARLLGFVHPRTKQAMRWESAPPRDLARAIERLRAEEAADGPPRRGVTKSSI